MSNRADMVETLLVGEGRAIDPNCRVANARVPLSLAASRGLYDVSPWILQNGAAIDATQGKVFRTKFFELIVA